MNSAGGFGLINIWGQAHARKVGVVAWFKEYLKVVIHCVNQWSAGTLPFELEAVIVLCDEALYNVDKTIVSILRLWLVEQHIRWKVEAWLECSNGDEENDEW